MTQAVMQQQRDAGGLGLVLVLVAGVWVLMRAGGNGGGNGGAEGPATVSGGLGTASVAQGARMGRRGAFMRRGASMSSHEVPKINGEQISVQIAVINRTVNVAGAPITWPLSLILRAGDTTLFGWRQWTELVAGAPISHLTSPISHIGDRTITRTFTTPVLDPSDFHLWDIRAWLFAIKSDDQGNPISMPSAFDHIGPTESLDRENPFPDEPEAVINGHEWFRLDFVEHRSAIRPLGASAEVGGDLGLITVTQQQPCPEIA